MRAKKSWSALTLALALLANVLCLNAQDTKLRKARVEAQPEQDVILERHADPGHGAVMEAAVQSDTFVFVSSEMSLDGKLVKGAPYSAQAVTETVQTFGDGNRIVRKNTASVYRDSEGRTRRDQTLGSIGPFAAQGDPPQTFFINDPVAGIHYILDPRSKTARKLPRFNLRFKVEGKEAAASRQDKSLPRAPKEEVERELIFTAPLPPPPPGAHGPAVHFGADVQFYRHSSKNESKTEKLEARLVEGVQAEGSRTVTTIPAGEIGNERPIEIVSERWYSPELQTVVMTRHSDPRSGETTYRLTNISRAEPSATLFHVPSDYTVKESPSLSPSRVRRMKRPAPPPEN
ncbi:MAG: hypothetical protein LC802_19280 [Acidobacteria bacterium]|nr:hypothetical protein [Acidobacteriota bacterium]